jgi:hypothetical protein
MNESQKRTVMKGQQGVDRVNSPAIRIASVAEASVQSWMYDLPSGRELK